MNFLKKTWNKPWGKGLLIGLPVAAIILGCVIYSASVNPVPLVSGSPQPSSAAPPAAAVSGPAAEKPSAVEVMQTAASVSPEEIWADTSIDLSSESYTLPQQTEMADGSLGILTIPKIGLSANVFETDDEMEAMTKGIAHFKITSAWQGNIGLCGHNWISNTLPGVFKDLHLLEKGDILTYKTDLGERSYKVSAVEEISETDWSYLMRTEDNRITLITCISGKPESRLCVHAECSYSI